MTFSPQFTRLSSAAIKASSDTRRHFPLEAVCPLSCEKEATEIPFTYRCCNAKKKTRFSSEIQHSRRQIKLILLWDLVIFGLLSPKCTKPEFCCQAIVLPVHGVCEWLWNVWGAADPKAEEVYLVRAPPRERIFFGGKKRKTNEKHRMTTEKIWLL